MAEEVSVHAIAEKGFAQSSLYDSVRPSYKHESVEFLLKKLGVLGEDCVQEVTVLELGAGTGLFTRAMVDVLAANRADKRVQIIATEPLASMCEKLRDHCPGIEIRQCRAESTDLADGSINAVIAAQSFHWFANQKALGEIFRILTPGGHLGLIWHNRDRTVPWVEKIESKVDKFYELYSTPRQQSMKWKDEVRDFGKFSPMQSDFSLKKMQEGDVNFIIDRYLSLSPVASSSTEEKQELVNHIQTVLEETGQTTFVLPQTTAIYWLGKS